MARYTGPTCKLARREGSDLMLKSASRPLEQKCRLKTPPGGVKRSGGGRKMDYLEHLREKQKLRRIYGVLEKQFRNYYKRADRSTKATGLALLQILESRLDNVVYRLGFAATRAQARQMVAHKLVQVEDRVSNIPSMQITPGQRISLVEKAKKLQMVKDATVWAQTQEMPEWVDADFENMQGVYKQLPKREAIALEINENLIVEYYSK
ncbi:MAG: 30S ribosomal protein S4 [Proteobacteria bacterium]|nr:30S ribosomal protein S4 [Pseudomonadota bacterium]MCH9757784.1 30S ribosomal protein S4 [Pseudomonadota bacterium]